MRVATSLFAISLLLTGVLAEATAFADDGKADTPKADAAKTDNSESAVREHFKRGVEAYDDQDYKLALIEFERAHTLSHAYRILYNIGQVHSQLGHYAKALENLELYLEEGGDRVAADRLAEVQRDIATLKSRTALLDVVGTTGADVVMDDEPLGKVPFTARRVNAGDHKIRVTKPGFLPQEKKVVLAGGDQGRVTFKLDPEPIVQKEPESRPAVWITWAGAAALGAGALVTGLFAMDKASDLKRMRADTTPTATRESTRDSAQTFAMTSDILLGAGIITAGVATYLTLKRPALETKHGGRDVNLAIGVGTVGAYGSF